MGNGRFDATPGDGVMLVGVMVDSMRDVEVPLSVRLPDRCGVLRCAD